MSKEEVIWGQGGSENRKGVSEVDERGRELGKGVSEMGKKGGNEVRKTSGIGGREVGKERSELGRKRD